jgi:hypothetical protein
MELHQWNFGTVNGFGTPVVTGRLFAGATEDTIHGANIGLTIAAANNFSNTLTLGAISIRETFTDRIRNVRATDQILDWPQSPIFGALTLRFMPFVSPGGPTGTTMSTGDPTALAVGEARWFQNGVDLGNAFRTFVATQPNVPPTRILPNGAREWDGIINPWTAFMGSLDWIAVEASVPHHAVGEANLGWFTTRFVAPLHYTWHYGAIDGQLNAIVNSPAGNTAFRNSDVIQNVTTGDPVRSLNRRGTGVNYGHNFSMVWEEVNGQQRHVLYTRINAGDPTFTNFANDANVNGGNGTRVHANQLGIININNLQLFPTAQAPRIQENLTVTAEHGWSSRLGDPSNTWVRRGGTDLTVGHRGTAQVAFDTVTDLPTVVSGQLGTLRSGADTDYHRNPGNMQLPHYRGVATARVRLDENIAGRLTTGWATEIDFTFEQAGVRILGARISGGNNAAGNNVINNFHGWLGTNEQRFSAHQANIQIDPYQLSVNMPLQGVANPNQPASLEVTFYLSVESDFVEKYGNQIDVTVSGLGVEALPAAERTIPVAYVQDPISVSVPGGVTTVATDATHSFVNEDLSNVVVTVNDPSILTQGSQIWLYLIRPNGGLTDVHLNAGVTATVAGDTGLQLGSALTFNHPHQSFQRHGVAFQVNRPVNTNVDSVEITFSNLGVNGQIIAGMEYQLVVSGTQISQNDETVRAFIDGTNNVGQWPAGTFRTVPTARGVLSAGPATAPDWYQPPFELPPPVQEQEPEHVPTLRPLTLREGMAPVHTVDGHVVENPFFMAGEAHGVGAPGVAIGVVNPRVFAHIINVAVDWDGARGADGTAILQGYDRNGDWVRVELPVGATTATVNGQSVDIATAAPGSGDPGTVRTVNINDRTFVPVRFLAEAFGYTVDTTDFPAITIRP